MKNAAYIDLDGVIANNTKRFERALKPDGKYDWRIALDPALVELDTLIEDAPLMLDLLIKCDFALVYLTGRPESMREATKIWLATHGLPAGIIRMRADQDYRHAGTVKAEHIAAHLVEHEDIEVVAIVDDEASNTQKILENTVLGSQDCKIELYLASNCRLLMLHLEKFDIQGEDSHE